MAAIVAREHDFFRRGITIVRDVEEVQNLFDQNSFTTLLRKVLANDAPADATRIRRRVVRFGLVLDASLNSCLLRIVFLSSIFNPTLPRLRLPLYTL